MSDKGRPKPRDDGPGNELPDTAVQLTGYLFRLLIDRKVIDSWPKTFRLAFLVCVPPLAGLAVIAAVVVTINYLKLDPQRWGLVAGSVVATLAGVRTAFWAFRRWRHVGAVPQPISGNVPSADGAPATGETAPRDR